MIHGIIEDRYFVDLAVPAENISEEIQKTADIQAVIGAANGTSVYPGLFGINMLFFTEQNSIREKETYQNSMSYLKPKVMRYPGGTCGDNYLWKKNDIYTPEWYPGRGDPLNDMDTDSFLDFAGKYFAEPIMLINYRSYIKMNDIEAFYKDAEDWVRHVNIVRKADVKYWELGNELYFKENTEIRCQVTPEEYGMHYLELRKRLKAIDPNIQLGITLHKDWINDQSHVVERWNERVMQAIECDADYIILHFYATPTEEGFEKKGADIRGKVKKIREGIVGLGGNPDIPLLITEWNFGSRSPVIKGQTIGHMVGLAQGFLEIIDSGFERATIWPLYNSDKRLLKHDTYNLDMAGVMFHWLNSELAGCDIAAMDLGKDTPNAELKAFISPDGKQLRIIAVNRSLSKEQLVDIVPEGYKTHGEGELSTMVSNSVLKGSKVKLTDTDILLNKQLLTISEHALFKLPPLSVSVLRIPICRC